MKKYKLIAVVGPTASGKSELAIRIGKKLNGEIVCADSRTVYKYMDIGTAKPSLTDQKAVAHYCIDLVEPNEKFSAIKFKKIANKAIKDIRSRGKLPILVGGSGLYVNSVIFDYDFPKLNNEKFDELELEDLQKIAINRGYTVSEQTLINKRHLISFIKRGGKLGSKVLNDDTLIIGIKPAKEVIDQRIQRRVQKMFEDGFIDEVIKLVEKYPDDSPGFSAPGYKPLIEYLKSHISLDMAMAEFVRNDKALAKRQMTWFKKNNKIIWFDNIYSAESYIIEQWS